MSADFMALGISQGEDEYNINEQKSEKYTKKKKKVL